MRTLLNLPCRRWAVVALVCAAMLGTAACTEAARIVRIAPQLLAPGGGTRVLLPFTGAQTTGPQPELPPRQTSELFDFEPAGVGADGSQLYRVRIRAGGSPYAVASAKLTPLFSADGKDAATYVADAYFQAHPDRTPFSIQPGDEFTLRLPADTFLVRWQEERVEQIGQPARVREYVSERGDRLLYYLTDPFPVRYELQPADTGGLATVQLHPDLAYLLQTGRTDVLQLAQIVYRVADPDIYQLETIRQVIAQLQPGQSAQITIDRSRTYLDPVRQALTTAERSEPVEAPERSHLTRWIFRPNQQPYAAIEDALGNRPTLSELEPGKVFRIEYFWNGVVRVSYMTGDNDALGKRDPYALRENERWAALYRRLLPDADTPVKWGPGEPSDLTSFPTARDPYHVTSDPGRAYDYLVPGRPLVLTFAPIRFESDIRAELEFRAILHELNQQLRPQLDQLVMLLTRVEDEESQPPGATPPLDAGARGGRPR